MKDGAPPAPCPPELVVKTVDMRSLSHSARHDRRTHVARLREAGQTYEQIAQQTGLSRTGVFDICKRLRTDGASALDDSPPVRSNGAGRRLTPEQESLLRGLMLEGAPDALQLTGTLWTRDAAYRLIEQRAGIRLPVRTLDAYLLRWGFVAGSRPGRSASLPTAAVRRWLAEMYPELLARSRIEDAEVHWARFSALYAATTAAVAGDPPQDVKDCDFDVSMLSTVTNRGVQRWKTLVGALDAHALVDFLSRLVRGASKKLFVILSSTLHVRDNDLVVLWLSEHVDSIEAVHLPAG